MCAVAEVPHPYAPNPGETILNALINKLKLLDKKRRVKKVAKRLGLEKYSNIEDLFTDYYHNNTWSGGKGETVSGSGSTLKKTALLREGLSGFFQKHKVKTLFDAPCGDYNWFRQVERRGVNYIGGEIVMDLVEKNTDKYRDDFTRFMHFDIIKDEAPTADMWFCREVLLHFSYDLIFQFLENFSNNQIPYLLVSTHHAFKENIDIPTGAGRPVNLEIAPFNLPPPIDFIDDAVDGRRPMRMALWKRETIVERLKAR